MSKTTIRITVFTNFCPFLMARLLPKYPGMNWKVICGSHDQSHSFNYGPFDFGPELEKRRKDVEYLGQDKAVFNYDGYANEQNLIDEYKIKEQ